MAGRMKQVSRLFAGSLRYLLFLEVVFKVTGVLVIMPIAGGILQIALRFSGIQYIATQNYQQAVRQPLLIIAFILIVLLMILFLSFEVTCITISYQQTYLGHPIGFYQLIKESLYRSAKLVRPSNWLLLPFSVFLLRTLFYFIQNSSNAYIKVIQQVLQDLFTTFPVNLIMVILAVLVFGLSIVSIYAYQFYVTQSISGWKSVTGSLRLMRKYWKRVCTGMLSWICILACALTVFHLVVYGGIRLGTYLLVQEETRRALTVTIYYYARNFINFVSYSLMAFGWYGYVASSYYRYLRINPHMVLKPIIKKKDPHARKRGTITVGVLAGFIVVTLVTNALLFRGVDEDWNSNIWEEKTAIMAHRGASGEYPENTMEAFQEAVRQGADYIELDCQLSSDGAVMVHHDLSLRRCWGISANVSDLTLVQLKHITNRDGMKIPTLQEVFEELGDEWIDFNIELKVAPMADVSELAQAVMQVITEYEMQERCIIQSFSYEILEEIKNIDDSMHCGYILTTAAGLYYDLEAADFFSMNLSFLTERAVAAAHLRNKRILVWTVNDREALQEAMEYNVDGIITDVPILAREIVYGSELPLEDIISEEDGISFIEG